MNRKAMALSSYRMENAEETLATAGDCLEKKRASDYDDFYVASYEETIEQFQYAEKIVAEIKKYIFDIGK